MLVTVLTEVLGTTVADAAAHNNLWALSQKRSGNACNETEGLHQQGPRLPQVLGPSKPLVVYSTPCDRVGTSRRAGPSANINSQPGLECRSIQELHGRKTRSQQSIKTLTICIP